MLRLIEFIDNKGRPVFVNPEKVCYVQQYREGQTLLFFDAAGSELMDRLLLRGSSDYIAAKLVEKEDKM